MYKTISNFKFMVSSTMYEGSNVTTMCYVMNEFFRFIFFSVAGTYSVELVNESLYEWHVRLSK